MTTAPQRLYKGSDTEMLLAISTILNSAITHKDVLIAKHKNWKDPFFETVKKSIADVLKKYVGVDSAASLRKATKDLRALQKVSFSQLADIRTSIETGFLKNKPRRAELLHDLGYTTYNDAARRHDQEALYPFLMQFAKACTPEVKEELINENASEETLDAILSAAAPFMDAETAQEGFKGARPAVTAEAITAYNDVYEQVMSIARNAARDFKADKPVAKQFSYSQQNRIQIKAPRHSAIALVSAHYESNLRGLCAESDDKKFKQEKLTHGMEI